MSGLFRVGARGNVTHWNPELRERQGQSCWREGKGGREIAVCTYYILI